MKPITIDLNPRNHIDRFIHRLGYIKAAEVPKFDPAVLFAGETYPGAEYQLYADYSARQFEKLAITNPWVYSNINLISNEVAQAVMKVQQRNPDDGEKWLEINSHDFERIVEGRPNPYMSQFFTWKYQAMWLLLHGESYWLNVPNQLGDLAQMYPLPADRLLPVPDPKTYIRVFAYTPISGGSPVPIPVENICYHRFPNPFDYHRGLSPLSAYLLSLKTDVEAAKFDLDDFENGLTLRQLISLRAGMSERDFTTARADIHEGQKRGDRFLVTRAGDVDVKDVSSRRDTKGDENIRSLTRTEANYVFGIPDGLRALNTTQANAEVADRVLKEKTIWPLLVMLAEDVTAQILLRYYDDDIRAVFEDIRPVNRELALKEKESKRKTQTYDQVRADEGFGPHPDPDIGNAPFEVAGEVYKIKVQAAGQAISGSLVSAETDTDGTIIEPPIKEIEADPKLALNGARITAAMEIITKVSTGELTREVAQNSLEILFNLTSEQASRILGSVREGSLAQPSKTWGADDYATVISEVMRDLGVRNGHHA